MKSKLQTTVADSTGYVENLAAFNTIKECEFLRQILGEMDIEIGPIPMFADATNTVSTLLHNGSYKQGHTRHHKIKVSCMYQYVKRGVVHPICIPSGENVADALTKSVVPKKLFFEFTDMMFGNGETYEAFIVKLIRENFKVSKRQGAEHGGVYQGLAEPELQPRVSVNGQNASQNS